MGEVGALCPAKSVRSTGVVELMQGGVFKAVWKHTVFAADGVKRGSPNDGDGWSLRASDLIFIIAFVRMKKEIKKKSNVKD